MKMLLVLTVCLATAVAFSVVTATEKAAKVPSQQQTATNGPAGEAVLRAKKTVQMLDDIYKQTIVLITDKYVHDVDDFAAGSAAVLLFENISAGGSHHVRLIDVTGEPYDSENVARDDFEREAVKQLKAGKSGYDQVTHADGKYSLRAMTPVPVVMDKCIMCHDHYADVKKGEPIGAISYTIPIE